ncbi:unnamed protein product [Microthlaspi erraticum]|uniref:Uncharacterized protein n=1 Tax=Microthlaspi erraticum TaxID=1685480 RepID=A0A6D2J935_9BRAS|nr:unnamed protein product [Microthlaspi erraticum]
MRALNPPGQVDVDGFHDSNWKKSTEEDVQPPKESCTEMPSRTEIPVQLASKVRLVQAALQSRPKSKTTRPITHHDPGNCPRSATPQPPRHRARPKRASRETPRGRATLAYRPTSVRAGRTSRVRPRISSAKSHPLDHADRP